MISKNEIKSFASLKMKKFRSEQGKFIVEGKKQIVEGITSQWQCEMVILTNDFNEANKDFLKLADSRSIRTEIVSSKDFEKLSDTKSPQGIIGIFFQRETALNNFHSNSPIVLLENISDPGNMGTILRSCDWFGIKNVLLSEHCADIYNAKVVRSTMGSVFHINLLQSDNYLNDVNELKKNGYEIVCTDIEGNSYKNFEYEPKTLLVLSSESHGPSDEILKMCDKKITIDKYGSAESLNVAGAAAIILAELAHHLKIS